jgi:GNAT superfamily N-acetyltransferase
VSPDTYALLVTLMGMRFRWDCLSRVVPVPYVPALGPVQPRALSAELFNAVVDIADTDRFIPYDKDCRWSTKKDERVIVDEIVYESGHTVIPTFARGCGLVRIYHYGDSPPRLSELTQWTRMRCVTFGTAAGRVIWFQSAPEGARTRLLLKIFSDQDKRHRGETIQLTDCPVADSFPMSTLLDSTGTRMQLPQYFAVHPHYRRRSHGRALWRAAMAWGADNVARYKVLQAAAGSASELLYISEGLSTLGFVCGSEVLLQQSELASARPTACRPGR